ncbi:S-layer homology domain-containing protein [Ureibacillus terrenus]|uniref:S-layer homology domain-containing protein n=1 Tax=Ureibacillus terrenus TaxID=118246 RepID=A0A540V3X8_9BACL|nr:S-layer homology domain-containing protein [Ureibacillus terrenus]MED3660553.1 S-layer homology domain-containing protein [Ureibacillus terrenus]TQE91457.1 S-layer homology domain-containing protein [Ureibacillus terrenus]
MKRKIRNVFLALFVAGGIAGIYPSVSHAISIFFFNDVRPSDYFYDAVNDLVEREIIHGYEDNTFRPYQPVTRGQAAKILANVLNLDKQDVEDPGFKDVSKSNEYYGAIAALVKEGIIHGYPDGTFRPNEPIQRNHMAKIIARAFNIKASPGTKTPFTDLTNKEYVDYIRALYEYKITTGTTPTTFSGTDSVKRGQMVVFVYRAENAATDATINISEINGDTIIAGNKEYQIPRRLQTLFGLSGKESFKGATVKAKVIGGSIYSITSIEFGDLEEADKHAIDKQLPVLEINGKRPNGKYSVKNNHFAVQYGKISVSSQDPITLFSDQGAVIHYILSYIVIS